MQNELFNNISEFIQKQDTLCKLTQSQKLNELSYSEIGFIKAVGKIEQPNGVEIAKYMTMTKGAITKIAKKLLDKGIVETYTIPENKQKIFYKLTKSGQDLFNAHEKRHILWIERDSVFFNQFDKQKLSEFSKFLDEYNNFLDTQIQTLTTKDK